MMVADVHTQCLFMSRSDHVGSELLPVVTKESIPSFDILLGYNFLCDYGEQLTHLL